MSRRRNASYNGLVNLMATSVSAPAYSWNALTTAGDGKHGVVETGSGGWGRADLSYRVSCKILNYGKCIYKMDCVKPLVVTIQNRRSTCFSYEQPK
jgi:hypothetical protein